MPFRLFSTTHDDVAEIWQIIAKNSMQDAAKEGRIVAISRGDVNSAGIAMIPVEANSYWSKRSKNKLFSFIWMCCNHWETYQKGSAHWSP